MRQWVVAVRRAGITAVGVAGPHVMCDMKIPVEIIPSRVNDHAVIIDTRVPFFGVVPAQADEIAAIGFDGIQGRGGLVT